jgi:hypothetical protein
MIHGLGGGGNGGGLGGTVDFQMYIMGIPESIDIF